MEDITLQGLTEYYKVTKASIQDYTTEDIYMLLTKHLYTELPIEATMLVYGLLREVKFRHEMVEKSKWVMTGNWSVSMLDYKTGKTSQTKFEFIGTLPVNQQDEDVYIRFLDHYIKIQVEYSFKEVLKTKLKAYGGRGEVPYPFTTPITRYHHLVGLVTTVSYWYLGKRKTDRLLKRLTSEYQERVIKEYGQSGYPQGISTQEIEKAYDEYRKLRGKTALNKGLAYPTTKMINGKEVELWQQG